MNTSTIRLAATVDDTGESSHAIAANASTLWGPGATNRIRNVALQLHWLALPNVTLEQAAWLLLDIDPALPPVKQSASTACPHHRHAELLNRLECEVAAGKLRPLKGGHPTVAPRLVLTKILNLATEIGVYSEAAGEMLNINLQRPPTLTTETTHSRINNRMHWHREFMSSLTTVIQWKIKPKRASARRTNVGNSVNMHLTMTRHEYDPAFLEFVTSQHGQPTSRFSEAMLQEDRRALNIELQRGRPPRK